MAPTPIPMLEADGDCDVMAIPHNPNLGGGLMFPDPATEQEAIDRLEIEPLVELVQHKGASECRFDRMAGIGIDTEDELCDFEQIPSDNLAMLGSVNGKMWSDRGLPVDVASFHRRNMMRNVLKDGLALEQDSGLNPSGRALLVVRIPIPPPPAVRWRKTTSDTLVSRRDL